MLVDNPKIAVDWTISITHGAERMASRGMSREMVDHVVATGKALYQGGDKYAFVT